ncbi:MAG: DUF2461 domain-containing protein [Chitinophagia bacterium]|jgi:uncharacterized protein (TIGR02453 family)
MIQKGTVQFLKAIAKNNHKEWLDANRTQYESAKQNFTDLISFCIQEHGKKDAFIATLTAKECLFRINRDIRFSKDKSPYKTNFGASIKPGGKKSNLAGYYVHLEPGGKSFVGGGMYMPEPGDIQKIRQEIDYNWEEFSAILKNRSFNKVFGSLEKWDEITLAREPKGYDKNNPAIEWLKLKSWVATAPITDQQITQPDFSKTILQAFAALQPLLYFLNRAVGDE